MHPGAAATHDDSSSLDLVPIDEAGQRKLDVTGTEVSASIGIGPLDNGGFGLTAALVVYAPKLDKATAQSLTEAAHQVCPYSNATRGNIEVDLSVVE